MNNRFAVEANADAALSDLVSAHGLIVEIAKHSAGYNNGRAKSAAALLEKVFGTLRDYCSDSAAEMLQKKLEASRTPLLKS